MYTALCDFIAASVEVLVDDRGSPSFCEWKAAIIGNEAIIVLYTEPLIRDFLNCKFSKFLRKETGYIFSKRYTVSSELQDRNTVAQWVSEDKTLYVHDLYLNRVPLSIVYTEWKPFSAFHRSSIVSLETDGALHVYRI